VSSLGTLINLLLLKGGEKMATVAIYVSFFVLSAIAVALFIFIRRNRHKLGKLAELPEFDDDSDFDKNIADDLLERLRLLNKISLSQFAISFLGMAWSSLSLGWLVILPAIGYDDLILDMIADNKAFIVSTAILAVAITILMMFAPNKNVEKVVLYRIALKTYLRCDRDGESRLIVNEWYFGNKAYKYLE
jgi:hypothetical protein